MLFGYMENRGEAGVESWMRDAREEPFDCQNRNRARRSPLHCCANSSIIHQYYSDRILTLHPLQIGINETKEPHFDVALVWLADREMRESCLLDYYRYKATEVRRIWHSWTSNGRRVCIGDLCGAQTCTEKASMDSK